MSRGIYEYLEFVGAALIADATLRTFLMANFKKTLKVYIGQDESDIPSEELCPLIVIVAGGRGTAGNNLLKTRSAKLTIAMRDDMDNKKEVVSTGLTTFPGLALLDEFADLVARALVNLAAHSSGYYVSDLSDGPDDQITFPVYKAFLGLQIQLDSDF